MGARFFTKGAFLSWAALMTAMSCGELAAAERYGLCDGESIDPPVLLILSRQESGPCFRELDPTSQPLRNYQSNLESNAIEERDIAGRSGFRFAFATEIEEGREFDRILSIKERHFRLEEAANANVEFAEEVLLTRKGEDIIEHPGGGGTVDLQGIRTLCGDEFYRDLEFDLAEHDLDAGVPLNAYNSYHNNGTEIPRGALAFFHISFQDERGRCIATDAIGRGGRTTAIRRQFAFQELEDAAGNSSFIARVFKIVGTAQAANDRYTTLVSRISTSYERNGYYISEFTTPLARDGGVWITVAQLWSPDQFRRYPELSWRITRPRPAAQQ